MGAEVIGESAAARLWKRRDAQTRTRSKICLLRLSATRCASRRSTRRCAASCFWCRRARRRSRRRGGSVPSWLRAWTARRREIAARYRAGIRLEDTRLPQDAAWGESVYHQFTLLHPRREALRAHLTAAGVGTDLIYPRPLHVQPCYAALGQREGSLPHAEATARDCLSLPIFPELTDAEIDYVIATINGF